MKSQTTLFVWVLAALAALAPFAIDTYLPAFHVMAQAFGADDLAIQQSLTYYLLPYAVMTLCHGAISDAIGRITTIKWGLSVFVLASLGCAFAPNVQTLWLFRALQGMSGGAGNTIARAMVRDLFSGAQAQRVMATVQILFGIAPALAPVLGGVLLGIHWQAIFIFLAIYGAVTLWSAVHFLPETMTTEKRVTFSVLNIVKTYGKMLQNQRFLILISCLGLNFSAFFIYVLASPIFLVKHLHLNSHQFGYLFIPTVTGMMFGSWLSRYTAGKYATSKLLRLAFVWMLSIAMLNACIQAWYVTHPIDGAWWISILPIAFFNIGMAMAMPILSIAALDCYPHARGTAASAQAFMQMLCSTLSSAFVVPISWGSTFNLAIAMMAIMVASMVLMLFIRRQGNQSHI